MDAKEFYATKLEGLKIIRGYLVAIDRVCGDLVALEDAQPCGDSHEEYAHLRVTLDDLEDLIADRVESVSSMVEMSNEPPKMSATEVHNHYVSSLR